MTTQPTPGLPQHWLSDTTPATSNYFSASMADKPADITASQTPTSPPPLAWLTTGDVAYRVLWVDYPRPSAALAATRPTITAVISLPTGDDALSILRSAIKGGTVALMVNGRTVMAYDAVIENLVALSQVPGLKRTDGGASAAIVKVSCAPDRYRAD